jgi:4a-hydroxytetrahydrobiopterin dehydratase
MAELKTEKCIACRKDSPQLSGAETAELQAQVPGWGIVTRDGIPRLERVFPFKDFAEALAFTDKVGELAQRENHHPAILTEWGKVTVTWWTHAIGGLHRNDFIMAAKTDALFDAVS